ncbi:MAG: PSD1 and planctomycete cytochrome C domain-containing protein [Phycisphaerales bacterium]|nr:PSD1 and planctomycete cytochrome C domain-containing protein [Phycisphaerales bacterium]
MASTLQQLSTVVLLGSSLAMVASGRPAQDVPMDEEHLRSLGEPVDYLSDVKPILVRRCYSCHGPDGDARKADLRFDDRADAIRDRDGVSIIVPGRADLSEMLHRIDPEDPDDRMPPEGEGLSPDEIDIIRRWVDQGAAYARHWSFEPVIDVVAPEVVEEHAGLVRDPIDNFILARLHDAGLSPASDAPPATQVRRLAFDLTGLPPSVAEVESFERDPSDANWDRLVDHYLDSPDFGERWGRHWLDLVRYAETYGHEFDYPIHDAWRYRDYVIRALNADVPYDRFLREHVAGDLLEPRIDRDTGVNQSVLATGFWHLHQAVHGPTDVRLDELERVDNQIDVLSKTFMGLTVSCARCHDHKFDPISQADYYGLAGYLRSSRRSQTYLDPGGSLETSRSALRALHRDMRDELDAAARAADDGLLRSTLDVVRSALVETGTPGSVSTRDVFEDFESGDFDGWTAEGTAFARGPQDPDSVRAAFKPHFTTGWMVNTCDDRSDGAGDADTGTLTSKPFTIDHPSIGFRISGGRYPSETCVELLVDGEVVRTAHGESDPILRRVSWDVSEFKGRSARIRIADRKTGGWAHVAVDDIVFEIVPGCDSDLASPIETVAAQAGLDEPAVVSWFMALHDRTIADPSHPLAPWSVHDVPSLPELPEPAVVLDDGTGEAGWYREGHAWPEGHHPVLDSGLVDARFQGTIRSRTFTLEHERVLIRARGRGTIRLAVAGFMMNEFNPLLFYGFKQDVNGGWRVLEMDVSSYLGERAWIELIDDSDGTLEVDWIAFDEAASVRVPSRSPEPASWNDRDVVRWLESNGLFDSLPSLARPYGEALARHREEVRQVAPELPPPARALVMQDGNADDERVLIRGDHRTPAERTPRGFITEISGPFEVADDGSGRLQLADAMLDPANPLTSRVAANRIWHHLTGRGIVPTTDDFGALGAMPSHPELLDHLATDLSRDWSLKRLIGRVVRSSVYRRSSLPPEGNPVEVDPVNDLLAHARIRRLQGEAIRDAVLAISGRLESVRHGPPVPIHLTSFMTGRGRPGRNGPLDGDGRRSIYLEVRRNFPIPFLTVFDLPVPTTTIGRRNQSNVPAQSLAMMNDPFIHEMARIWAERARATGDVGLLWREAYGRTASESEQAAARSFLDERTDDRAWIDLCHVLLNTKEFTHLD